MPGRVAGTPGHQRYEAFPFRDLLAQFAQWLIDTEYGQDRTREHVRRLRQALELAGLPIVAIFCSAYLEQLSTMIVESPSAINEMRIQAP